MDRSVLFPLLLLSLLAASAKYVLVHQTKTWWEAQKYCRWYHTELAPVSSAQDIKLLGRIAGAYRYNALWIGLIRDVTDWEKWRWSGAGEVERFFWGYQQPTNIDGEDYGVIYLDEFYDSWSDYLKFFCYQVFVVRERRTWLEALEYCRENHRDIASIGSEAEMTLIWRELEKNETTEHVWIGLHFFPGFWLWTDGQSTDYEAWGGTGKPECPRVEMECAALRMEEEQGNGTVGTQGGEDEEIFHQPGGFSAHGGGGAGDKRWEARDCEEKLYFVCY